MVAKKGRPFIQSSLDGVVVCTNHEEEAEIIPFEIKTRVGALQVQDTEEIAEKMPEWNTV